jgi:HEAT repeat protein
VRSRLKGIPGWTAVVLAATFSVHAQLPPSTGLTNPEQDHLDRLRVYQTRIVDPQARLEERRNWAEALVRETVRAQSAQSRQLVLELLGPSQPADIQRAVCEAIPAGAGADREHLDGALADPLFHLLGSANVEVRSAASRALGEFQGQDVTDRLAAMASGVNGEPLPQRLAAIDALAANTHRRDVVAHLVELLDVQTPEIVARVTTALEPMCREPIGNDAGRWREWWAAQVRLSDEAWLADQLRMFRGRLRASRAELEAQRERSRKVSADLAGKLREFQRETFRLTPVDLRDAKLVEWLNDPQDEVKSTAMALIKARIADEGKRPEGEILATLLRLLKQGSPSVRRDVLTVVQNLNDPTVVKAVLALIEEEKDTATREAAFRALGRLNSPESVPVLMREILSSEAPPECVREAAGTLGQLAQQPGVRERAREIVAPLQARYQALAANDTAMRAGLLTAMAGLGDPSFAPDFLLAVEADDPAMLRPAIQGLRSIGDSSKLSRLRRHTANPNPLVRLAAIEAVGQLGREDADLEALLQRVNPAVEQNDLARDAAWKGFRQLLRNKPVREQIRAAAMLREVPDREAEYLNDLAESLRERPEVAADLEMVRDRLANLFVAQGKFADAVPHLRELYTQRSKRSDSTALDTGLRLLDATLRTPGFAAAVNLLQQLSTVCGNDDYLQTRVVETVGQFLESPELVADAGRSSSVLAELKNLPPGCLGNEWAQLMRRVSGRLEAVNGDRSK